MAGECPSSSRGSAMKACSTRFAAILLLGIFVTAAAPQELGRVHFQTSCTPQAQQKFDRGLAMVHSFVYPDSVAAFTELLRPILECAIAYRRIAISHRPLVTLIFGFGVIVEEVQARDFGQYANSSAEQRKWFKDLAPPGRTLGGLVVLRSG
jgi:hypothetical protein